jgi:hypothetical protein
MAGRPPLEPPTGDHRIIWDILLSRHVLPAVAVANERGIFTLLAAEALSSADVAARLKLTEEWSEILLGVLAALGLLRTQDGRFQLTDTARSFLLPESPFYSGFTLSADAARSEGAQRLRTALDNPESLSARYSVREWQAGELTPQQADMRSMHGRSFPAAVGMARNGDFQGVQRLLDVAGGSGGCAIALAQRYPEMRCTVLDLPVVCVQTRDFIVQYGVEDQVDTLGLNMFFETWPTGYDAILFSCVLHDWSLVHRTELLKRAFDALPDGGRVYIHELLLADSADGPVASALFSLSMRVGTAGKQFTAPELRGALTAAGFQNMAVQNTHGYFSLVSARKPASTRTG